MLTEEFARARTTPLPAPVEPRPSSPQKPVLAHERGGCKIENKEAASEKPEETQTLTVSPDRHCELAAETTAWKQMLCLPARRPESEPPPAGVRGAGGTKSWARKREPQLGRPARARPAHPTTAFQISVKTSPKPDTREPSVFPIMVQMKLCRPAHFKRKVLFPTGSHCGYAVRYTNSVKENR